MSITVVDAVVRVRDETADAVGGLKNLALGLVGIGALAGGAVATAFVTMGMEAQTQLSIIQGLAGLTAQQMVGYTAQMEDMGAKLGSTLDETAKGMYYVVSANFRGADAFNVLNFAMMAAKASGAELSDVTHGLAGALNAYGAGADQAAKYSDIMTAAVVDGMQSYAEFTSEMGQATAVAAQNGVAFMQLAAAESSITNKGLPAQSAFQGLAFSIGRVMVPADEMNKKIMAMGGHFDAAKWAGASFVERLVMMHDQMGISETDFIKLIGGTRSQKAALDLVNDGGKAYRETLVKMAGQAGITADAFKVHDATIAAGFEDVKAALSNAGYELVKFITPAVVPFLQGIAGALKDIPALFSGLGDTVTRVDGPIITFGKHIGETSSVLSTHKGFISQVRDFLAPLGDTYTQATRHTANFRGDITSTSAEMVRHKGILSNLQDFMTKTVVPAIQGLGQAFVKYVLPALKDVWDKISKDLLPALKHLWDELSPYLIPALQLLGFVLVKGVIPGIGLLIQFLAWTIDHVATTIGFIKQLATWSYNLSTSIGNLVKGALGDFLSTLGHIKDAIWWVIQRIGELIDAIGKIHLPDIGSVLGGVFGGGKAAGGLTGPGVTLVGEQGPELAIFPTGTRIIPAAQTAALMGGSGGGSSSGGGGYRTANITIMLDSRVLVQGLQQPLVDQIRIATGLRI